ncbi:MAG: pentapeptide repeat-containing protein [Xenococcaceae cyanobacterium]
MTYCLNPSCPKPINHPKAKTCKACGSTLLLRDRYHLVKGLGKGGFGATFLAADISLPGNPLCVIKQLRPNTDNPQFLSMARQLFEREAKTLGKIGNHPQIPRLLDYFEDRKQFYLVQEFVQGNTLQQEVKKNGVFNESQAKQVLKEILTILKDIHAQKVIHRDIKPANIIRRELDQKLVLIDFGVVKNQVNTVAAGNSEQTALTAFAVGTPGFAPPEQLAMRPVYASDIYALGITCMYLMTGKAPKNMECDPITGEIDWFKNLRVSDHFTEILTTMLEVSVKNRYKTADEALGVLDLDGHIDSLADSMISSSSGLSTPSQHSSGSRHSMFASKTARGSSRLIEKNSLRRANSNSARNRSLSRSKEQANSSRTKSSRRSFGNQSAQKTVLGKGKSTEPTKLTKIDKETLLDAYANGRRDFRLKDLSLQDLEKVDLSKASFKQSKLIRTNFQGAELSSTNFSNTDTRQASFRNAHLGRAYFVAANLEGVDFRGADLSFTRFDNAKLKGVNFCGANLTSATITKEQLAQAKTNWTTILPNGRRGFW